MSRDDRPFDLLLSDIELPDGLGLTLMRELRDRGGLRGIAMSGFGAEEDLELSREAGFLDHLIKPIEPHRLDAAIRRARAGGGADETDDEDEMAWSPARGGDSGPFRVLSTHERSSSSSSHAPVLCRDGDRLKSASTTGRLCLSVIARDPPPRPGNLTP